MAPSNEYWLAMLLGALVTFLWRSLFILPRRDARLSPRVRLALRYVAPSVLAALAIPAILAPFPRAAPAPDALAAAVVAGLVVWRTRSILFTIAAGLLAAAAVRVLLG